MANKVEFPSRFPPCIFDEWRIAETYPYGSYIIRIPGSVDTTCDSSDVAFHYAVMKSVTSPGFIWLSELVNRIN
jgi:hypothetical protein